MGNSIRPSDSSLSRTPDESRRSMESEARCNRLQFSKADQFAQRDSSYSDRLPTRNAQCNCSGSKECSGEGKTEPVVEVATTAYKPCPQLASKTSLEIVKASIATRFADAEFRVHSPHSMSVYLGRGRLVSVYVSKKGRIKSQFNGGSAVTHSTVAALLEAIANPPTRQTSCDEISTSALFNKLDQQGGLCFLSGRILTPENVELEHLVARANGGDHTLSNTALVVKEVNRAKGTMDLDEFIQLCNDVARSHPR